MPLPPRDLSPNRARNVHWSRKAPAIAAYRKLVELEARSAANRNLWVAPPKCHLRLRVGLKSRSYADKQCYHPRDWDNGVACFKAGQDGLVDAGVILGDDWRHLSGECDVSDEWDSGIAITLTAC